MADELSDRRVRGIFFMSEEKDFGTLLEENPPIVPQVGEVIKGKVITASKSEVTIDFDGIMMGIVRGPELYIEVAEYANLKPGDDVEAAVIEEENENGELELSFRKVGQEKAWDNLRSANKDKSTVTVKIIDANKGGLLARYCQINGFLPVSQLAPENYPRISGGDKSKILEKLKGFVGQEFEVNVMTLNETENKIIFSEKDVWTKRQKPALDKYKIGMVVDGKITAVTNFGLFVSFDEGMEGLIHISELAWQRIDSPNELYHIGDKIQAEIVGIEGAKIFLSAKKLMRDPWQEASAKYQAGQVVKGTILKVNPFGLFVKLDEEIHGLAHISQIGLAAKDKITDLFKAGEERDFEIVNISPSEHRLGLKLATKENKETKEVVKKEKVSKKKTETEKDSEVKEGNTEEEIVESTEVKE